MSQNDCNSATFHAFSNPNVLPSQDKKGKHFKCAASTVTPLAVMQGKINQFPFCCYLFGTLSCVLAPLTQTQLLSDMLSERHHSSENEQRLICHYL